ncbi:hypothetical protein D2T29_12315 [Sinirhodobacter populi]|uniref:Uncharacterized protein n=1 Tax=Paenirhodobacter populi TaxID=2306993 RepID=A0A443KC97_9RHOB|nr:hypothetical protein [Sinirhodobacter populi]RWR30449.1 hypothetical protein D2T29_12315 [Sinirhodobacter populi]
MTNLVKGHTLYIRSMGRALRVTGMFLTDEGANDWIAKRGKAGEDHGVVACLGPLVLCAELHDRGLPCLPANPAE